MGFVVNSVGRVIEPLPSIPTHPLPPPDPQTRPSPDLPDDVYTCTNAERYVYEDPGCVQDLRIPNPKLMVRQSILQIFLDSSLILNP